MHQEKLKGIVTALVTPLTAAGELDEDGLGRLINTQLTGGIKGLFKKNKVTLLPGHGKFVGREDERWRIDVAGEIVEAVGAKALFGQRTDDPVRFGIRAGLDHPASAGAAIGTDGFGYAWDGKQHMKVPQIGTVTIEDDVELGACTCVDRAKLESGGGTATAPQYICCAASGKTTRVR